MAVGQLGRTAAWEDRLVIQGMKTACWGTLLIGCLVLPSCLGPATDPGLDPFEGTNRRLFAANEWLDGYIIGPLAGAWDAVVPSTVELGLYYFFRNLGTPLNAANHLLQAEWNDAGHELKRFLINTTYGLLGFRDKAEDLDIFARPTDLGMTLDSWGVPPGPYLVLPVLGPATVRSALGMPVPWHVQSEAYAAIGLPPTGARVGNMVNTRAIYAGDIEHAREMAFDYYGFARDSYLQSRGIDLYPDEAELWDEDEGPDRESGSHAGESARPTGDGNDTREALREHLGRPSKAPIHLANTLERQELRLRWKRQRVLEAMSRSRP